MFLADRVCGFTWLAYRIAGSLYCVVPSRLLGTVNDGGGGHPFQPSLIDPLEPSFKDWH
jgi:hypothetical protein